MALVGCGDIAYGYAKKLKGPGVYTHCDAIWKSPFFSLVAVCDSDLSKARECAVDYKIPNVYASFDELLSQESVDVIVVCTPDSTHASIALSVLSMPALRAIVIEKPVATSSSEAVDLITKANQNNVLVVVNYTRRYSSSIQSLRKQLHAESIRAVSGYYTKGVMHNGTHWFDLAEFLGAEIARVKTGKSNGHEGFDPTFDVDLEFLNGAAGFLKGCDEHEYTLFEMDILTDKGRYILTDSGRALETWVAGNSQIRSGYRCLFPVSTMSTSLGEAIPRLWENLLYCLGTGDLPISNSSSAIKALTIAEAVIRSSKSGKAESIM